MNRYSIYSLKDDWQDAKARAARQGLSISFVIRVLLRMWLDNRIELDLRYVPVKGKEY